VVTFDAANGVYVEFKRLPLQKEIEIYQEIINLKPDNKDTYYDIFNHITLSYSKEFKRYTKKRFRKIVDNDNFDTIASLIALWYNKTQEIASSEDLQSLYKYDSSGEKEKKKDDTRNLLLELDIYRTYTDAIRYFGYESVDKFNLNYLSLMLKVIEIKTYQQTLSEFRLQTTVQAMAYGGDYKEYVDDLIHYSMGNFNYKELKKEIQKDIKEQRDLMQTIVTQYEEKLKEMQPIERLAFIKKKMNEVSNERVN
jgi:hypothetical protein